MSKLVWDQDGERFYETGIDHFVLFKYDTYTPEGSQTPTTGYMPGIAWSGITSVSETPEGGEANDIYADNIKYLSLMSAENLNVSLEAYTYPDEFMECDGTYQPVKGMRIHQQRRKKCGFAYRTRIGNDTDGDSYGYKIHVIYNCLVSPSDAQYQTVNDSPEAITFSWEGSTTPVEVGELDGVEYRPTSRVIIDSRDYIGGTNESNFRELEAYLFGRDADQSASPAVEERTSTLLMPDEIYKVLTTGSL